MDKASLLERLQAAIDRHLGENHRVTAAEPLTGGASSPTWRFHVTDGGTTQGYILRLSQNAPRISTGIDKRTEAKVQLAALAGGVSVAPVTFILDESDNLGEGFVMEYVQGESVPRKLLRDEDYAPARAKMTAQCGAALANIHATDISAIPELPTLGPAEQIAEYDRLYRTFGESLPTFEFAFRWLRQHLPEPSPSTLVHGDFRNGNFLVTPANGIVAVMDWELAHQGDGMEDLGWLCVNSWRFGQRDKPVGGFGERSELYQAYENAGGANVDPARIRFWEVFGTLKWGIMCLFLCSGHLSGHDRSVERAAIGRRVSETELDLLQLL